jgi:hypothetical protein
MCAFPDLALATDLIDIDTLKRESGALLACLRTASPGGQMPSIAYEAAKRTRGYCMNQP